MRSESTGTGSGSLREDSPGSRRQRVEEGGLNTLPAAHGWRRPAYGVSEDEDIQTSWRAGYF